MSVRATVGSIAHGEAIVEEVLENLIEDMRNAITCSNPPLPWTLKTEVTL